MTSNLERNSPTQLPRRISHCQPVEVMKSGQCSESADEEPHVKFNALIGPEAYSDAVSRTKLRNEF